jgi:hypothetical protein
MHRTQLDSIPQHTFKLHNLILILIHKGSTMQDIKTQVSRLKRPKLLVSAARLALKDYRRKSHLSRILRGPVPAKASAVLGELCDMETHLNTLRKTRDAAYSAARHIEVLVALIAETQRNMPVKG